jgi:DedD protein
MEKKKLLLVMVSVGVFLVIVISAAILIVVPKASAGGAPAGYAGTSVSSVRPVSPGTPGNVPQTPEFVPQALPEPRTQPASVDPVDMVRNADGIQGLQPPPQTAPLQENRFYLNGETAVPAENSGGQGTRVISVPAPSTAAVPDAQVENVPRPSTRQTAAPAVQPAARQPAQPAAKPAPAAPKPAPAKLHNDYWVQTGAFSAKVRAENAKENLASKGITSIIENRVIEGKTWYRVRVGPYTSENEANYWLSLVKTIDGFGESQVRLTPSRR